jgi:hypothetical protein
MYPGVIEGEEGMLFQHGIDGDRFEEVEGREAHGKAGELDEGVEATTPWLGGGRSHPP